MKTVSLILLTCGVIFFASCKSETTTSPATVIGLSDKEKLSDADKEAFKDIVEDAKIVDVILKDSTSAIKAAIFDKELEGKTFPFPATFHSGDGFKLCGCDIPYVRP